MAKGIHLEADSTTQEFKLYHGKGGLYIGKAILKNNVFVLDFVPDLGTADSDAIVNFTDWIHPPDLDPDFSPGGFWYSHTIPETERTRALATIQQSATAETTSAAAETTSAAAETTTAAAGTSTPVAGPSTASLLIDDTPPTPAQQLNPARREAHRSANITVGFYSNSDIYRRSPGHRTSEETWHARMGHPSNTVLNNTIRAGVLDKDSLMLTDGRELQRARGTCFTCPEADLPHQPFPSHHNPSAPAYAPLEKVYSDILYNREPGQNAYNYTITFIDATTRYVWHLNLPSRDMAFEAFLAWLPAAERESGAKLKSFQSDGGGEYTSQRPPAARAGRFSQRAQWGLHLGIEKHYNAWKIFDVATKETVAARDVIFYERLTLPTYLANLGENQDPTGGFRGDRAFSSAEDEADWDEQNVEGASEEAGPLPYCSVDIPMDDENPRESINVETYYHFADNGYVTPAQSTGQHDIPKEPATVQQALGGEHKEKWREAMDRELKALEERNTWKVVPISVARNKTILTGKWVFRVKTKADGTIEKDLRGTPHGTNGEPNKICQLLKSLYGIKQAPRLWQQYLHARLIRIGFKQLPHDQGMYRLTKNNDYVLLIVYVDDLLYIGSTDDITTWFEGELQQDLTLTVSSTVTQYLGLNIREEETAIYLSAEKYADTIANRFALTPTAISTPYRYTTGTDKGGSTLLKPAGIRDYQRKLGCLLFAAVTCRPDLSYSASQLATYLKRPEAEHLAELDRALHYFVSTPTIGLTYHRNATTPTKLIGYVDADHAGDSDNRRSRTGYIYRLEPIGPISWQSSKQELIALSSAEAEYIALCSATKEGLYLRELLEEAKLAELPNFTLFCDNQSAIRIANKSGFANRTKHIALRYFFVKDEIEKGRLELSYCPTSEMAADYLTKKLGKQKFEYCMLLTGQGHVTCSDTPEAKGSVGNK
ncbi:unnamed protein product [Closterium sp. Yama58-4]|nr:unnamed protein product [Closterium sp. Yama58-4]